MHATKADGLYLRQQALGPMKNFIYLIGASGADEAAVIDPAWDVPEVVGPLFIPPTKKSLEPSPSAKRLENTRSSKTLGEKKALLDASAPSPPSPPGVKPRPKEPPTPNESPAPRDQVGARSRLASTCGWSASDEDAVTTIMATEMRVTVMRAGTAACVPMRSQREPREWRGAPDSLSSLSVCGVPAKGLA
jgi:hypothetical protein